MKKVSIVLPTYNGEKFIRESIESIINQTYKYWELIIVDDGSTDNTPVIIKEFEKKDSRIKVITNTINQNLPNSLNIGFRQAEGEYYTWTSDDNMFKHTAIEVMVNLLNENNNIDLVSLNYDYIDENDNFVKTYVVKPQKRNIRNLVKMNNIGACFMYKKEITEIVGTYDSEMFCAEDYDYWFRIALNGNILYRDDLNLYSYRINSKSLTATKIDVVISKMRFLADKYSVSLMKKLKMNNLEIIGNILDLYYGENKSNPNWLLQAKEISPILFFLYKKGYFLKKYIENPSLLFNKEKR